MSIIKRDKSIEIACDVSLDKFEKLVQETTDIEAVGAYKIGFYLGLGWSLPEVVKVARQYTDKPLIYDHQKASTDIPETGKKFAEICKSSGIDAVILLPQSGPETEKSWIKACQDESLQVIVGGLMTHKNYVASQGGFITDEAVPRIYEIAADLGVKEFVVPGNKPEEIRKIKNILEKKGINEPIFHSPGLVAQGGKITEAAQAAGKYWHAIVGRGIYESQDFKKATLEYASQL